MIDVTPFAETLHGRPVAVLGLGISNMAAIRALLQAGVEVWAWDDQEMRRDDAKKAGAAIHDLREADLTGCACLLLAPGVPLDYPKPHPVVIKAREAGREIICDLEILHRCNHGRRTIGITGTNGKSTTTALTSHILGECGVSVQTGGNIGRAALDLDMPPEGGAFIFEISSFQLDLCPTFRPDIAVHLNFSPDHIDRHGTIENYLASKLKIFGGPGEAVIGVDDKESEKIHDQVKETGERRTYPVSGRKELKSGVSVFDGTMFDKINPDQAISLPFKVKTLPGNHNHQNAAAAYTVARLFGLESETILAALQTYPGLPHRQFLTAVINGIAYVNDSKATNAVAAVCALSSYRKIYWIVGGRPKDGGLNGTEPYLKNVKHAFVIGDAMDEFGAWLEKNGVARSLSGTLERAVQDAHAMAQAERGQPGGTGTVLLSPACASFDQFKSFEERGDRFTALVHELQKRAEDANE